MIAVQCPFYSQIAFVFLFLLFSLFTHCKLGSMAYSSWNILQFFVISLPVLHYDIRISWLADAQLIHQ